MNDTKAQLRFYAIAGPLGGLAIGIGFACVWRWVLWAGTTHHVNWIVNLSVSNRVLVAAVLLCIPVLVIARLLGRASRKLADDQAVSTHIEETQQRTEVPIGLGWTIPRSFSLDDFLFVAAVAGVTFVIGFLVVLCTGFIFRILRWLIEPGSHFEGLILARTAWVSARACVIAAPLILIPVLLILPRRVTLISEGVVEWRGKMHRLFPYPSIQRVCISPSRRRRTLKCLAILFNDRGTERWHRYDLGKDAPVTAIVKAFEAKGIAVEATPDAATPQS